MPTSISISKAVEEIENLLNDSDDPAFTDTFEGNWYFTESGVKRLKAILKQVRGSDESK